MNTNNPEIPAAQKQLQVLILITKANWGGAQRYVYDVATNLPKDQFRVKVTAGGEGILTEKLGAAGINAFGSLELGRDVNLKEDIRSFFKLVSLLRKDKPDVLHLNSSKIGGLGALAGRLARVPRVIFTVHGWAFNEKRPFYQKLFIKLLYWVTIKLCHETMVVSEAAKKQIKRWPLIQDKLTVVYNGVDKSAGFSRSNARLELSRMNPALKKALEGVSESNLVWIGTVAELHPIKGYVYALDAIERTVRALETTHSSKKVIYTIIGDGELRAAIEARIKELKLENNVILMGRVDKASEYMKAFDVFLLASLSEGLGYVLIEAGMASAPVIATSVGGIPEIIDDMQTGILVQPKNARELSHAISYMIEHPEERRRYGASLRDKVLKNFTLELMILGVQDVYLRKEEVKTKPQKMSGPEASSPQAPVPADLIATIENRS